MRRQKGVTLPDELVAQWRVSPTSKRRAMRMLSQVGLLLVRDHGKGRAFTLEPVDLSKEACERLIAKLKARPRIGFTERVVSFQAAQRKRRPWKRRS
jgi:hypothetical protein